MTTIKDIARQLGLSESTVSRALTGNAKISVSTRRRVIEAARAMNYFSEKPTSILAEDSKTVGLIVPEISANYYVQLVSEIEGTLRRQGISIILGLTDFDNEVAMHYLKMFANKKVNGIICEITPSQQIVNELLLLRERYHIPVLLMGEIEDGGHENFDTIAVDEQYGMNLVFDHLLALGHREIALVGDEKSASRRAAFLRCYEAMDKSCPDMLVRLGPERFEQGGYLRMKEVLDCGSRPTAVVATYDACALGAMRAIREAGLTIPEDISLVGIDDGRELPYFSPSLTSVKRLSQGIGDSAAQMLMGKVTNNYSLLAHHLKIYPELVARESTGPVRQR